MTDTTAKRRTITLTNRRPVTIIEADWPIIAEASGNDWNSEDYGGLYLQARDRGEITVWWLKVRQHKDGRAIVYGGVQAGQRNAEAEDWKGGKLITSEEICGDVRQVDLPAVICHVGQAGKLPGHIINACIADLPAEDL